MSLPDLRSAVQTLQMDLSEASVLALFAYLDEGRTGAVSRLSWNRALATANADAVLESRGVGAVCPHSKPYTSHNTQHTTHSTHS